MILAAAFTGADAGVLVGVLVLLAFAALLALAETGLVRMSKARARALVEQNVHGARRLAKLVEDPEGFLAPVLLLVLICQLVAASLVSYVSGHLFGALGFAIATVFEVIVIFVAAESVPKHWAVRHVDRAALIAAPLVSALVNFPPVRFVASVLIGISRGVSACLTALSRLFGHPDDGAASPDVTESELLALADVAVEAEVIEKEERVLFSSIIEFGDTIVREVMAPRLDVVAVEESVQVEEAIDKALAENRSRLPVYATSVDDIVGVLYTLDLVESLRAGGAELPVAAIMRPAHYVPETKRVAPLLRQMQAEQFQLAVVVDEYGGTAGIVTLEDLVEELVGDIADEFDAEEPLVHPLEGGSYLVSGKLGIGEVSELLGVELPDGDWDTVAGLLLHLFGHVPAEGSSIALGEWTFTAERVLGRRIKSVRIDHLLVQAPTAAE